MAEGIVVIQGSPKRDGNTARLVRWFAEGAGSVGASVEIVDAASIKYKVNGCASCRACQRSKRYECAIDDGARAVLAKMAEADAIVLATPLYFFAASAQLKIIVDRMFSLYKWDNKTDTFTTPLRGKSLVLIASAYEDAGLKELEAPFRMTAEYSGMSFQSLLIPNAGVSGGLRGNKSVRAKAIEFGKQCAGV